MIYCAQLSKIWWQYIHYNLFLYVWSVFSWIIMAYYNFLYSVVSVALPLFALVEISLRLVKYNIWRQGILHRFYGNNCQICWVTMLLLKLSYHSDSKSVPVIISSNIYLCKPPKHFIYLDYWLDILKFESMESKFLSS